MGEWQPYLQSIIIGFTISFFLAKLFSSLFSVRDDDVDTDNKPPLSATDLAVTSSEPLITNEEICDDDDDDDDWEGVESSELEEAFSAATAFVRDRKVSSELKIQLYALYKIATEGPSTVPQPSVLNIKARAKWQAWHKLGAMPPEEAMHKYIAIVTELDPTWDAATGGGSETTTVDPKGPTGPVFSTYVCEEDSGNELKMEAIHAFAREGEVENLLQCIENGVSVDLKDSEGRTAVHWAVDRGHLNIVQALVSKNADLNAKDNEGQTPLHYAAVCGRETIIKLLVEENADAEVKDNDGNLPRDLCQLYSPVPRNVVV